MLLRFFVLFCLSNLVSLKMSVPKLSMDDISQGIEDYKSNISIVKVLEGILNDFMYLQYEKETPYTTGQEVLPVGTTIEDIKNAINSNPEKKIMDVLQKIYEVYESGDRTPQSVNDGSWNPKFTPILVFIGPDE